MHRMSGMCSISERYGIVYFLIAKNATSSIRKFLEVHCEAVEMIYDRVSDKRRLDSFTKWTALRDPLARFYSAWNELIVRGRSPFRKICTMNDDDPGKWPAFSTELRQLESSDPHFVSQHKFLRRPDLLFMRLDRYFRVDDALGDNLTVFFRTLGIQPTFNNRFRMGKMRAELEKCLCPDRVREVVREVYLGDYELIDSCDFVEKR